MTITLDPRRRVRSAHGPTAIAGAQPDPRRDRAQRERVYAELERGGAIRVYTNDMEHFLGVLTRDQRLLDAADIAQLIENGHIPPLDELVAMDDRGELP